jgi:hypothetical protein
MQLTFSDGLRSPPTTDSLLESYPTEEPMSELDLLSMLADEGESRNGLEG